MSAELNITNGVADVISVRETPWHREGTVLPDAPTFAQALELAHLDYDVLKVPAFVNLGTADEPHMVESTVAYVTMRADTKAELGSVGKDYQVVQNREAFAALEPLLDTGAAAIETAGVLREGADAWMQVKFTLPPGQTQEWYEAQGIEPYGTIATNHAGRRGILVQVTPVRIVCANTLTMAEGDGAGQKIVVRHTGDAEAKIVEASQVLFADMIERFALAAEQYETLRRTYLSLAEFRALVVDAVTPNPTLNPRWNPEARMANAVVARYEAKVNRLEHLWKAGSGHTGDGSAWEAYNGTIEALDHDEDLWPNRGGVYRTASLMHGVLRQTKDRVLGNLLGFAAEPTSEEAAY